MTVNAMVRCPSCNNIIRKMRLKFDGLCPICSENKQLKWELKELPRKIREVERLKEEKLGLAEEIMIRDKEIERLKKVVKEWIDNSDEFELADYGQLIRMMEGKQ